MGSAALPALSSLTISSAWRKIRFFRAARRRDESAGKVDAGQQKSRQTTRADGHPRPLV
jgi:hypothetical protein